MAQDNGITISQPPTPVMTEVPGTPTPMAPSGSTGQAQQAEATAEVTANAAPAATDVIVPSTLSADNPAADNRNMRRIIAEDPEWSLATVPLLVDLGVQHIVNGFHENSKLLNDLLPIHKKAVLDKLPPTLPLKITANLINDQDYWKRCCKARWNICDVSGYNDCWKRMYFERNLENIIEHFVPEKTDPTLLEETLPLSAKYVRKLDIKQLLPPVREAPKGPDFDDGSDGGSDTGDEPEIDHFDFSTVLQQLPNLTELHLVYGVRDCGMNFEWGLFQFTNRDVLQLAYCIAKCTTLKKLKIHRSNVNDEKIRVLISHNLNHPSITDLDVSHNIIGDRGARALGKFINNHSQLTNLDASDNQIRTKGAQAIAHGLTKNTTLKSLNLRLNRLSDEGGQAICRALKQNTCLVDINLASNELAEPSCAILSQVLHVNKVLRSIDLSCNPMGQDGGKQLQEGMEENSTIIHMDLRLTECGQESEYCINQILEKNKEADRVATLAAKKEASKLSVSKVESRTSTKA